MLTAFLTNEPRKNLVLTCSIADPTVTASCGRPTTTTDQLGGGQRFTRLTRGRMVIYYSGTIAVQVVALFFMQSK